MKTKFIICLLSLIYSFPAISQITLENCYQKAHNNYPLIKQYDLIKKTEEFNLSNAAKGYLPQVSFSAKASYQSEVTKIPVDIQGIDGLSKDQYGIVMDVGQTLWDGGAIKSKKEIIRSNSETSRLNLEVNMYGIRERINQLYFGTLLIDEQLKQNDIYENDLQKNLYKISSYAQNGIANQADIDAVKVELLKAVQNRIQLTHSRKAYIEMLSSFIGEKLEDNIILEKPSISTTNKMVINRPELQWYDAQIRTYATQRLALKADIMPKLGLFLTSGYGRPGLNMLDNNFKTYYIGGIKLSWNLSSLYTHKNSNKLINNQISTVQSQKETFLLNTQMDVSQKENIISSYKEQLRYDDEIITLRKSVKQSSEAKMANGTLSGIDLVRDINAENLAIQDKSQHEIKMLFEIYNLKFTTNN